MVRVVLFNVMCTESLVLLSDTFCALLRYERCGLVSTESSVRLTDDVLSHVVGRWDAELVEQTAQTASG